ncbi:hypothetical protein [Ulvibacterium sp.]|uniref:hypothetical protein n=1 Tax=Ulvibacterium sp. TaxID=2665914 RepID=UPI003BA90839
MGLKYSTIEFYTQIFFLVICFSSYTQSSFVDKVYPLQQDPILREKVYIHTNKTDYFADDTIWFKAYVGDTINYPSLGTTKLYVNLLDASGVVIYNKNIFIDEGTGQGEFELNSAVSSGKYYIQAYTNYMRNFGEAYHYLQEITVLGDTDLEDDTGEIKYDVQLFPESGNLLEATESIMGIKAMINGMSADFKGKIVGSDGKPVAHFVNQHQGMSRCKFQYKAGERYTAQISINNTLLKINVPKALKKGVVLHTDNSDDTYLKVALKTNETTFYDQIYSNYTLLFHQNHQIYGLVSVARLDSTLATVKTDKNVFLDGVNTVTLFEDDRPIAERKFFVEKEHKKVVSDLAKLRVENDSVTYKLRLSRRDKPVEANLSVSILTNDTRAYDEKQNLRSTFLLTSHLKGHVENPAYYFDPTNKNRKEHVDLLLLTQGWSKYTLKRMIQELNPRPKFEFEQGFELRGELHGPLLHNRLALIADNYQVIDKVNLKKNRNFDFKNLVLYKGDTLKVSYLNWLGKFIKPDTLRFEEKPEHNIPFPRVPKKSSFAIVDHGYVEAQDELPLTYETGTIALEGVTLTDRKLSQRMIERRALIQKYKPMVPDIGQYFNTPVPENFKERDLMSFLRITEGIQLVTSPGVISYLEGPDKKLTFLFVDGRMIEPPELPASVFINMKDVANVMIGNKFAPMLGGTYMFVQVFTKDSYRYNTAPFYDQHIVKDGYDMAKEYYTPLYVFERSRPLNLLEVDWKPNLKTNKKGEVSFKIAKDEELNGLFFSIQGFSNGGHLISRTILTD